MWTPTLVTRIKRKRERKCYYQRLSYDKDKEHYYYTDNDGQ